MADESVWQRAEVGGAARGHGAAADRIKPDCPAYINEKTPLIIALNRNFEAYMIKSLVPDKQIKEIGDIAFNLVDEHTVKRLTVRKQKILPPRRVLKSKDVHWNKKKLQNALLQGILQGDSIGKLAGRFQDVTGMNHTAAIRNARTAFTGAQNGGRQAAYEEAYQMGIDVVKHWTATKDLRTRDSHSCLLYTSPSPRDS